MDNKRELKFNRPSSSGPRYGAPQVQHSVSLENVVLKKIENRRRMNTPTKISPRIIEASDTKVNSGTIEKQIQASGSLGDLTLCPDSKCPSEPRPRVCNKILSLESTAKVELNKSGTHPPAPQERSLILRSCLTILDAILAVLLLVIAYFVIRYLRKTPENLFSA